MWITKNSEPEIPVRVEVNLRIKYTFPLNPGIGNNKFMMFNVHACYGNVLCGFFGLTVRYTPFCDIV